MGKLNLLDLIVPAGKRMSDDLAERIIEIIH